MTAPLCFVLMPFGSKTDAKGVKIDFDAIYEDAIAPAARRAELEPLRADEEAVGGVIHKPMFERLVLADYAIADLTTANANVFYELGVRHAVRPFSTVLIGAVGSLPFDVALDRTLPYEITRKGALKDVDGTIEKLAAALRDARAAAHDAVKDSPVFQLLEGFDAPDLARLKTDVFREQASYSVRAKDDLARARREGADAVRAEEARLRPLADREAGILVDLLLSYRATSAWEDMIRIADEMSRPLVDTALVQEQLAFGLNRAGRGEDAERTLKAVLERYGPSSETYGLLGRVYKDRWKAARADRPAVARGELRKAIAAYRSGFEADWRDAYPGVNALTLMEILEPGGAEQQALMPVVRYAVERRIAQGEPDYWDQATLLELAVIDRDRAAAEAARDDALALVREPWEPASTADNLQLLREARAEAGEPLEWADAIEQELRAEGAR